jgi:Asp-tRNA(Asn)/Glu-tRNA(Gln) amidotransferase A subunit family amidase
LCELIRADGTPKRAAELLADVRAGTVDAHGLADACRRAVERLDPSVGAWIALDWAAVARQVADLESRHDWRQLPLAGLAVAVKDIFDTADFPTAYGSEIYAGHRPAADAAAVATLKDAGAVVVGKSVSTEFAYWKAGKTRNPLDPARSPGGSSSGSAAAVAAGMVPLAIGSQTAASTIRPASYCGIVGFKPTLGLVSLAGVKPLANSLDTAGVFARDVAGAGLIAAVLTGRPALAGARAAGQPPSFRLARAAEWSLLEPATLAATEAAAATLAAAGAAVADSANGAPFADLYAIQTNIMAYEAARELAHERVRHWTALSLPLQQLFEIAGAISADDYDSCCAIRDRALDALDELFGGAEFLLAPSTLGEAPLVEDGTGSPDMSRAWTLLGLPSITVPIGAGLNGMPLGLQVAARPRQDARLLSAAAWIEARLGADIDS